MTKTVPPSIERSAFSCPHCGVYTTQYWHDTLAKPVDKEDAVPFIPGAEIIADSTPETADIFRELVANYTSGQVFLDSIGDTNVHLQACNLYLSQCFHCKKHAVWVHDRIVFPTSKIAILPNEDLPDDIARDFEEARSIANESPRGAAALLRLCIQKLCKHLGEKGKNIDDDIASLVGKGLNPLVQRSLDIVRVIGNEAVHPGTIDLNDNRETALKLFEIVNAIADQMISHPKSVQTIYQSLPEPKRKAIDHRNSKAVQGAKPSRSGDSGP